MSFNISNGLWFSLKIQGLIWFDSRDAVQSPEHLIVIENKEVFKKCWRCQKNMGSNLRPSYWSYMGKFEASERIKIIVDCNTPNKKQSMSLHWYKKFFFNRGIEGKAIFYRRMPTSKCRSNNRNIITTIVIIDSGNNQWMPTLLDERLLGNRVFTQFQSVTAEITY